MDSTRNHHNYSYQNMNRRYLTPIQIWIPYHYDPNEKKDDNTSVNVFTECRYMYIVCNNQISRQKNYYC